MRLIQHKVLLLQQLQPHPAQALLQDLQKVLDQRRSLAQRPDRRRLQEEQKGRRQALFLFVIFITKTLNHRIQPYELLTFFDPTTLLPHWFSQSFQYLD